MIRVFQANNCKVLISLSVIFYILKEKTNEKDAENHKPINSPNKYKIQLT